MAITGTWTIFNKARKKVLNGTINLDAHDFHVVLLTSAQALSAAFVGGSGDCRYADFTAEVASGSGYATGGYDLGVVGLVDINTDEEAFIQTAITLTLSGGITYKYAALVDWTAANQDALAYLDLDTGGGSISPTGTHKIVPGATRGCIYAKVNG